MPTRQKVLYVLCTFQQALLLNVKLRGDTYHADVQGALQLYDQMQQEGVEPNQITLACILKVCANATSLDQGKRIHAHIIGRRFEADLFVTNALINLYARCGDLEYACKVFKKLHERNVVTWTVMIAGYAEHGHDQMAFQYFEQMKQEGVVPGSATFLSILKACSDIVDLKLMHSHIIEDGFYSDVAVASNLIIMYADLKSLHDAHKVFDKLQGQDVVSWNALITGYAQHGQLDKAIWLLCRMQEEKMRPDNVTWNALISGYCKHEHGLEALQLFQQMQQHGTEPDTETFACALRACSIAALPQIGKLLHEKMIENGLELDLCVGQALLNVYMTCGSVKDARNVFDRLKNRTIVSWNTMISGYMQIGNISKLTEQVQDIGLEANTEAWLGTILEFPMYGHAVDALKLYCEMKQEGIGPDQVTFVCILKACSRMMALNQGKQIYADIVESGLEQDILISNVLIDLYAKCDSFKDSYHVFDRLHKRSVVTYNTIIAACAQHSVFKLALDCFDAMRHEGVMADGVTFLCLFSACSHVGRGREALCYFNSMREGYGVVPTFVHYTCMVDLLGRTGHLKEGEDLLQTMPFRPNIVGWTSLLSHCRIHGCLYIARQCIDWSTEKESGYSAGYALM